MADSSTVDRVPVGVAGPTIQGGRSVYGLRVSGLDDVAELGSPAGAAEDDLIPVQVRRSLGGHPALRGLDGDRGVRALPDGRHLLLDRAAGEATFYGPPIPTDELPHPYLGPVAVTFNRWAGREVFHAGAFAAVGHAWLVLGPRTAGKSTLTAALAAARIPILADDLVVTDGTTVWAGPRSIDLREALPTRVLACWPANRSAPALSPSRLGTRLRMALPTTVTRWPLGGWFFLHWNDHRAAEPVALPQLLGRLAANRCLPTLPSDPARMLSLASRPAWDLRRPREWAALPATVDLLLNTAHRALRAPTR